VEPRGTLHMDWNLMAAKTGMSKHDMITRWKTICSNSVVKSSLADKVKQFYNKMELEDPSISDDNFPNKFKRHFENLMSKCDQDSTAGQNVWQCPASLHPDQIHAAITTTQKLSMQYLSDMECRSGQQKVTVFLTLDDTGLPDKK